MVRYLAALLRHAILVRQNKLSLTHRSWNQFTADTGIFSREPACLSLCISMSYQGPRSLELHHCACGAREGSPIRLSVTTAGATMRDIALSALPCGTVMTGSTFSTRGCPMFPLRSAMTGEMNEDSRGLIPRERDRINFSLSYTNWRQKLRGCGFVS